MYCGYCGNEIPDNSTFCPHCGKESLIGGEEVKRSEPVHTPYVPPKKNSKLAFYIAIPIIAVVLIAGILFATVILPGINKTTPTGQTGGAAAKTTQKEVRTRVYDPSGNLTETREYERTPEGLATKLTLYDKSGNMVNYTLYEYYDDGTEKSQVVYKDGAVASKRTSKYIFNNDGKMTSRETVLTDSEGKETVNLLLYEYEGDDVKCKQIVDGVPTTYEVTRYETVNDHRRPAGSVQYKGSSENDPIIRRTGYSYDGDNTTQNVTEYENNRVSRESTTSNETENTYDASNRLIKSVVKFYIDGKLINVKETEYETFSVKN